MELHNSLKRISKICDIRYQTARLRLDRIINNVKLYSDQESNSFVSSVVQMVIEENISLDGANESINNYRKGV